ncbi:MAG: helix-turn-helix domain-containing protein [Pseudomonadota bacterium]
MPQRICFLVYPGFELLDYAGPMSVFASANRLRDESDGESRPLYELVTLSAQGGLVASGAGVAVTTAAATDYRPQLRDTLLVVGAAASPLTAAVADATLTGLLAAHGPQVARWGAICSGAFVLAATGLLAGRRVATHWLGCERLAREHPELTVDDRALYVVDGTLWTSAGVSTGIDMALAMVREDAGAALGLAVARRLVLYAHRPGYQSQFSDLLRQQSQLPGDFGELLVWLEANLHHPIRVADMAAQVAQSERTFARRFAAALGLPPARYLETLRLERARALLAEGARVKQAAHAVGFRSEAAFRTAFEAHFGVTPSMARQVHAVAAASQP